MSHGQDLKADKQLSLLLNDLAGTHQMQRRRMKARAEAPSTKLLYVPLHAAGIIRWSM